MNLNQKHPNLFSNIFPDHEPLIPHIGQRIIKTTIAVFLCLMIYSIRGFYGQSMPTESAITAIICMQHYIQDSRAYAINRLTGTAIGAVWGLLLLLLLAVLPQLGASVVVLYALMAIGVMLSLYSAVLLRKPDVAGLAAIVFLCIVIAFPDISEPLRQAGRRFLDVFIGTFVAIGVNVFRLPHRKDPSHVFFVRTKDLAPERFSQIPPSVMFRLNYLYNDGAKICMISEHAPAFFAMQLSHAKLSVPMIVMDGAALYDVGENRYVHLETILAEDSNRLRQHLIELGVSFFIYTVHRNQVCIFHNGILTEQEKVVYDRMRRSPYRSYLDGEIYKAAEVVYFKIIDRSENLPELEKHLREMFVRHHLRGVIRPQAKEPGISALYIYSRTATVKKAEKTLMTLLREQEPNLTPAEVFLPGEYRTERDAMRVVQRIEREYEPLLISLRKKRRSDI